MGVRTRSVDHPVKPLGADTEAPPSTGRRPRSSTRTRPRQPTSPRSTSGAGRDHTFQDFGDREAVLMADHPPHQPTPHSGRPRPAPVTPATTAPAPGPHQPPRTARTRLWTDQQSARTPAQHQATPDGHKGGARRGPALSSPSRETERKPHGRSDNTIFPAQIGQETDSSDPSSPTGRTGTPSTTGTSPDSTTPLGVAERADAGRLHTTTTSALT